jgi:hypothetical protein
VNTLLELGGNVILGVAAYRAAVEEQTTTRYQVYETRVKTR